MDRKLLRILVRCRRLLLELHALPPGTLPEEIEDEIEDLLMPGYREKVMAAYLASLPPVTSSSRPSCSSAEARAQ
jgi:hypothetical protein